MIFNLNNNQKGEKVVLNFIRKKGVVLITLAAVVASLFASINVTAASFPYNAKYPYGFSSLASSQAEAKTMLDSEWQSWKAAHITSNGAGGFKRVQRDASTKYDTVSEGLGYGLILAVYFDEQALFNDLFGYVKAHTNGKGFMNWHIDPNGSPTTNDGGSDGATDADEDIALALIFAHKKWGSNGSVNYQQEAQNLLRNFMQYAIDGTVLKPGESWGGSQVTNPSYFAPAWYKIFAKFTGDNRWIQVADKCYEIIDKVNARNNNTGLVPDWCTADGTPASGKGYDFYYDATRYPWRTAIDYSWFGDERAKANCDKITAFYKGVGADNIVDGYTITGGKKGQYKNASFVAPAAAGTMTGLDLDFAKTMYDRCIEVKDSGDYQYYGNALRMMILLYITGNFPNLYEDVIPNQDPSPSGGSSGEIKGDLNADQKVNSTDYALMRRYILGIINDLPAENDLYVADMNDDGRINSTDYAALKRVLLNN